MLFTELVNCCIYVGINIILIGLGELDSAVLEEYSYGQAHGASELRQPSIPTDDGFSMSCVGIFFSVLRV